MITTGDALLMAATPQPESRPHRFRPLLLEMLFIFVGVTAAFLVDDYRDRREAAARAVLLAGAIHQDIGDARRAQAELVTAIDAGLGAFEEQIAAGQRPVPYVLEISGSLEATSRCVAVRCRRSASRDFADPALLFELSYYYSESQGGADNFVRYSEFTEREFWPVALSDSSRFYREDGQLRGEFKAHIQQLRDYRSDIADQVDWGMRLQDRLRAEFPGLESAKMGGPSIYGSTVRQR